MIDVENGFTLVCVFQKIVIKRRTGFAGLALIDNIIQYFLYTVS